VAAEPAIKRAVAFVDGQNLFHAAREAFGHTYPNYDVSALANAVCQSQGWNLMQVRFYTGVPDAADTPLGTLFGSRRARQWGGKALFSFPANCGIGPRGIWWS
jgi:hypothetical protein